ncbi:MAG: sugar transferase [Candidatus Riflebacteria bacterium]|nr:sugar transferase [Candidatus Riflebacteria bacterium]
MGLIRVFFRPEIILSAIIDSIALILAGVLSYLLRTSPLFAVDPYLRNPYQYLILLATAILFWHVLLALNGGYRSRLLLFRIDKLVLQLKTSIFLLIMLITATFLYHQYDFSRLILFFGWLLFVFIGGLGVQIGYRLRENFHRRGWFRRRGLLAGTGEKRALFTERLRENPAMGIELPPYSSDEPLTETLAHNFVDDLFLFEDAPYETVWKLREVSKNPDLTIHMIPSFGNLYARNINGGFFDGMVTISLDSPTSRYLTLTLKRVFDILVSGVFMIILAPLFFFIAILVSIDSPGPILFRQIRIGLGGIPFTILKFRTMFRDADAYAETPVDRRDPRITRVGGFLRSTGLDELPQLWNVLVGEMSLVGPRPEMPFIVDQYGELERKRLIARPGITGLWQVYARSALLPIHSHIEYDLYYVENMSLSLDLMILLDTIPTLILRTGI